MKTGAATVANRAGGEEAASEAKPEEDVVDAEFSEVDDENKG